MLQKVWMSGLALALLAGCSVHSGPDENVYSAMSDEDVALAATTMNEGLEQARQGEVRSWANPSTGTSGTLRVGRTFVDSTGAFCREFEENIELPDGRSSSSDNTACRGSDGEWHWI